MVLTDEQYAARAKYIIENYPGRTYTTAHVEATKDELKEMFRLEDKKVQEDESFSKTLARFAQTPAQAAAGPTPKKLPAVVETITHNSGFVIDLIPVWRAQRGPNGTLKGDGTGGNWHGGDDGGNETVQGSGPIPADLSYWYRIAFMKPDVDRYLDVTVEALEEVLIPTYENRAAQAGFSNWDGLDYTGENDKIYLDAYLQQDSGQFKWGDSPNASGWVPVDYSIFDGGLPLQGVGGWLGIDEVISEHPGDGYRYSYPNGVFKILNCPTRSGVNITSMRNDVSVGTGMKKTPTFRGSLLRRGCEGPYYGTPKLQKYPHQFTEWEDLRGRGWLNIYEEYTNPIWTSIFPSTALEGLQDYSPSQHTGGERIYFKSWVPKRKDGLWAWTIKNSPDANGIDYCADLQFTLTDAYYGTLYAAGGGRAMLSTTQRPRSQSNRGGVTGPAIQGHVHDICLPVGPGTGRHVENGNPCSWPGTTYLRRSIAGVHNNLCPLQRNAVNEPLNGSPLGTESTEYFEITWLRGRTMKYVATTPAVRSRFINQLLTELGTRTGIFNLDNPGTELMGGADGNDGGVAELYRTDKYQVWHITEAQPTPITGVGKNSSDHYLTDSAYPSNGYAWTPDP